MLKKLPVIALIGASIFAQPAQAKTPPTLWLSEAKLVQKKLAYKITPRIPHKTRTLGPCVRINRLAVDCTAEFTNSEKIGNDTLETVRKFKVTVRRTATSKGYQTHGEIVQVSYKES